MSAPFVNEADLPWWGKREVTVSCALGLWSAALAVTPGITPKAALVAPPLLFGMIWWSIAKAHRWLTLLFLCLLLTPPIPGPIGDAGLHAAPVFVLVGLVAGMVRLPGWDRRIAPLGLAFVGFASVLLASVGQAAVYSGATIAFGSLLRVVLFCIGIYVFLYASEGPREAGWNPFALARFLFLVGAVAAAFACVDYYYQFPAPAGFEPQFVWLSDGVFRRAQGLFYEASTLGNFCAFFLTMIAVAFFRPRGESPCSRAVLAAGGAVFSLALILSYSRGSVINVMVGLAALAVLRGAKIWKPALLACLVLALTIVAITYALPSFATGYWSRIAASFQFLGESPDSVLSGRLGHWEVLGDFLMREPWHAVFGIGYKTLPYSDFTGEAVIGDNTYLSLLVETGIVGLTAFLVLNAAIFRYALRAARSARASASFFGEWIFCFWAGQAVQMFSGDLITYWRVLPVYFWVLGTAVRETERER